MWSNATRAWCVTAVLVVACGADDVGPPDAVAPDASPGYEAADWLFEADRVLTIDLTLAPADWDALRLQTRNLMSVLGEGCGEAPTPTPFTFVPATITIDGREVADVAVRKKGFLGSLDAERPSLIVDFDRFAPGQQFSGLRRMTLNNNKQDPELVDQCLGYGLFAAAGVPASRCNYAVVSVNGAPLGVYTHVEAVGPPMLGRHFADAGGNLYEGTLSDFRDGWLGSFDRKTNEGDPSRADLEAVRDALALPDDAAMATAVEALIDLDGFFRFWAIETMTAHWDGYAGNVNNFFVYGDPTTGKLVFMPWGTDQLFGAGEPRDPGLTRSLLTRRLFLHAPTRDRYLAAYASVLDDVWDDAALLAEVDRLAALVTPHVPPADAAAVDGALAQLRGELTGREASLRAALASAGPADADALAGSLCFTQVGTYAATFDVAYGAGSTQVTVAATAGGAPYPLTSPAVYAGPSEDVPGQAVLFITAVDGVGRTVAVFVAVPDAMLTPGTLDLAGSGVQAALLVVPAAGGDPEAIFYLDGTVTLTAADATSGAPVIGSIDATTWASSF